MAYQLRRAQLDYSTSPTPHDHALPSALFDCFLECSVLVYVDGVKPGEGGARVALVGVGWCVWRDVVSWFLFFALTGLLS